MSTNGSGSATSNAAILGVNSTAKLVGTGQEFPDIVAPSGSVYDQILLGGAAAAIKADANQILRISFIDLNDDIVQVEYSGAGTLTLVLDGATGPAAPTKYNQATTYMKGHAGIVLTGADETTNLSVFSGGRANAANQAPFRSEVTYDRLRRNRLHRDHECEWQIRRASRRQHQLLCHQGFHRTLRPRRAIHGPGFPERYQCFRRRDPGVCDRLGQRHSRHWQRLAAKQRPSGASERDSPAQVYRGSDSHGKLFDAMSNKGKLEQNGTDVTSQIVVNPTP
ncbi:MAG: hypothetical protein EXS43_06075 [Opitutus sp.]|nr:hypothetical protein [Opitutus sp.]